MPGTYLTNDHYKYNNIYIPRRIRRSLPSGVYGTTIDTYILLWLLIPSFCIVVLWPALYMSLFNYAAAFSFSPIFSFVSFSYAVRILVCLEFFPGVRLHVRCAPPRYSNTPAEIVPRFSVLLYYSTGNVVVIISVFAMWLFWYVTGVKKNCIKQDACAAHSILLRCPSSSVVESRMGSRDL